MLLATALSFCFLVSYLSEQVGLAPIVGAFAAGLLLEPAHYADLSARNNDRSVQELIAPIADLLVPIFFVIMGLRVDLHEVARPEILIFAGLLTVAAVLGKQACGLVVRNKTFDRVLIGLGMIPRGEVGLICASIGSTLVIHGHAIVSRSTYGSVVLVVMITTLITPLLIKWRFAHVSRLVHAA